MKIKSKIYNQKRNSQKTKGIIVNFLKNKTSY